MESGIVLEKFFGIGLIKELYLFSQPFMAHFGTIHDINWGLRVAGLLLTVSVSFLYQFLKNLWLFGCWGGRFFIFRLFLKICDANMNHKNLRFTVLFTYIISYLLLLSIQRIELKLCLFNNALSWWFKGLLSFDTRK